jgi:hypothetical protein
MTPLRLRWLPAALLVLAAPAAAQGFGYTSATPHQASVRVSAKTILYGSPTNPTAKTVAFTARDSSGFSSAAPVLFEFEEMWYNYNNFATRADITGICTDYNTSTSACNGTWQTANTSATSRSVTFPSLAAGSDVAARSLGIRVSTARYNTLGQLVSTSTATVARPYFLAPAPDHFFRDGSGNEVAIWRQRAQPVGTSLNKPLLIAEGIDISDRAEPDEYYGQLGPLANVVRGGGYDIAVVSFGSPLQSVRTHQTGMQNAVRLVHQMKADAAVKTTVMGLSRGGVVARYALAKMEETGVAHNTSLFISYDAPQRGANINSELQSIIFDAPNNSAESQVLVDQMKSDAVRELLQDHVSNRSPGQDKHTLFYNELRALNGGFGYPQTVRRVAWSNGTWSAPTYSGNLFVEIDASASGRDRQANITALDRQPGSFLPGSFNNIIDGKTGNATEGDLVTYALSTALSLTATPLSLFTQTFGGFFRIRVVNDVTFMPTASALDKDGAASPSRFDRTANAPRRLAHDAVPDAAVAFILEELGLYTPPPPPPLTASLSGTYYLNGHGTATLNAAVSHGTGSSYTYRWYHRPPNSSTFTLKATRTKTTGTDSYSQSLTSYGSHWFRVEVTRGTETAVATREVVVEDSGPPGGCVPEPGFPCPQSAPGVGASVLAEPVPDVFTVHAPSPNPARGPVEVRYDLPEPSTVRVAVYDVTGREVAAVVREEGAGYRQATIETSGLPSGVYVLRVTAGSEKATHRITVVR